MHKQLSSMHECGGPFYALDWIASAVLGPNDTGVGELELA